jgi:hypothetical protein
MVEPGPDINPVFLNAKAPTMKRGGDNDGKTVGLLKMEPMAGIEPATDGLRTRI